MSGLKRLAREPVRGPIGVPPIISARLKDRGAGRVCMWFLYCTAKAEWEIPHATLGDVPACNQCKKRVEANEL